MVNTGGPSKGCITCIKRKIWCDRGRPTCSQCQKSKRTCAGYRDATDVMFRDQTNKFDTKALAESQSQVSAIAFATTHSQAYASSITARAFNEMSSSNPGPRVVPLLEQIPTPDPNLSLRLDEDSGLVDFFANNFTCSDGVETRTNLFWIPANFRDMLKDESAKLSVQCAGAMALARMHQSPHYLREAQKKYGEALINLNAMWQNDASTGRDTMLIAVLFLSFFEILACYDASCPQTWRAHLYGLGGLFEKRGEQYLHTEFGARMFRQTRSQVLLSSIQSKVPVTGVFATFGCSEEPLSARFKKADEADGLLLRLCDIQARLCAYEDMMAILFDLLALDEDFRQWTESVPPSWAYSMQQSKHPTRLWWDMRYDVYPSTFKVHVWNKIRAAQIIVHDLVQDLSATPAGMQYTAESDREASNRARSVENHKLAADICATIPMHYRPSTSPREMDEHGRPPLLGATYWWLWPLEVVGTMKGASPELTRWVIQCLEQIFSTTGIKTAQIGSYRVRMRAGIPIGPPV